jgi:arsenate reductase (thioredoxin)
MKKRLLFLCNGNSCRSQMAEALVNSRAGAEWQAYSAGSRPAGVVHPKALQVLAEIGIQHHGRSKSMDEFRGQEFDLVITVCDDSAEDCPVWLGKGRKLHYSYPDPAETDQLEDFRKVRDAMLREIIPLLEKHAD